MCFAQHLCLKVIDLALECVTLYQYLERGDPRSLIFTFASLIAANASAFGASFMVTRRITSGFYAVLMDFVYVIAIRDHC